MYNIREMLRAADPLRYEQGSPLAGRNSSREVVLQAVSAAGTREVARSRSWNAVFAIVGSIAIAGLFIALRAWSPMVRTVQAAVSFEVRLAETSPADGLTEAKVSGSDRTVYVHQAIILANRDVGRARVIEGRPGEYGLSIEFTASGAEKVRKATSNHIGRPVAILIGGKVVMAPVLRTPIDASAIVTGNYTKAQAERIVKGLLVQ